MTDPCLVIETVRFACILRTVFSNSWAKKNKNKTKQNKNKTLLVVENYDRCVFNGNHYNVSRFAHSLRVALWQEHLGLSSKDASVEDPVCADTYELWQVRSSMNTAWFEAYFPGIPSKRLKTLAQCTAVKGTINPSPPSNISLQGSLVDHPIDFLADEKHMYITGAAGAAVGADVFVWKKWGQGLRNEKASLSLFLFKAKTRNRQKAYRSEEFQVQSLQLGSMKSKNKRQINPSPTWIPSWLSTEALLTAAVFCAEVRSLCNVGEHGLVFRIRGIQKRRNVSQRLLSLGHSLRIPNCDHGSEHGCACRGSINWLGRPRVKH